MSSNEPNTAEEPSTFKIQILPAGSAPKADTYQPNVNGERAAGQPNNEAEYEKEYKGKETDPNAPKVGNASKSGDGEEDEVKEIKSAAEREPEVAGSY